MDFKNLQQFIDLENDRLMSRFGSNTQTERVLARTVKLTEELGELCNEILAFHGDQRQEKLDALEKDNLPNEFADVIITTLLLAKSMNVDIEKALEQKMEKINQRYS